LFFIYFWLADKTKPTSNEIFIYTVKRDNQHIKIVKITVADIWKQNNKLRINNYHDKNKTANSEKDIKCQVRKICLILNSEVPSIFMEI
jgi:hypothetical protein